MFKQKKTWVVLSLAVLLFVLAGCGGDDQPTIGQSLNEPIDLYLFSLSGGSPEWFENTYGKYLKEIFPHVTFNVFFPTDVAVQDYISAGEPVDILFGAYTWFHNGILSLNLQNDISDLIKTYNFDLDKIDETVINLQRQLADGGIYGLPAFIGTSGLYYNKDIFDKFAVEYPRDNMTWDEVYDLAVKLTRSDGGEQYYGFANDNLNYITANQLSLDPIDPETLEANLTSDGWVKIVQNLARFMTISGIDLAEATVANFNNKGNVAMATNYTGCCGNTPGKAVQNWDVVRIPDFPDLPNVGPQAFPNYWFMSSISKNRNAAFEVIAYVASEEFQISLNSRGLATALKDTSLHEKYGQDLDFYNGKNVSALFPKPHAEMAHVTKYHAHAARYVNNALNEVVAGTDINTALRKAEEELNQFIQSEEAGGNA